MAESSKDGKDMERGGISFEHVNETEEKEASARLRPVLTQLGRDLVPHVCLAWKVDYSVSLSSGFGRRFKRCVRGSNDGTRAGRDDPSLGWKKILSDVRGRSTSGTLTAIVGPSGSGKTSLLNVLSGRVPKGAWVSGTITLNGRPRGKVFKSITAYVLQQDVLFPSLTVRETLYMACLLRLPREYDVQRKREICTAVMQELGLTHVADTPIGDNRIRGISGGERKRTNIAVEMISDPALCFLDEPTSGLDSYQAMNVMSTLSMLAGSGRAVMSTIHQPRSSIFHMFDRLLLLSNGKVIYSGQASEAVAYFQSVGYSCPRHYNPSDYFMDLISTDTRSVDRQARSTERVRLLTEHYAEHREEYDARSETTYETHVGSGGEGRERACKLEGTQLQARRFGASWTQQYKVLLLRAFRKSNRDLLPFYISLAQSLLFSIILGLLYNGMGHSYQSIQDRTGVLFFITINMGFGGVFGVINTFPAERIVVHRERASRSYRVSTYYFSKILGELHIRLLPTLLYSVIIYYFVGLYPPVTHFLVFIGVLLMLTLTAQAYASIISALVPTPNAAFAVAPAISVILILFGGFYINENSIPPGARWVKYLSPFYYGFYALMVNEFKDQDFGCPRECAQYDPATGSCTRYIEPSADCVTPGTQVLNAYGFTSFTIGETQLYQLCLLVGFHLLTYVALRINKPRFSPMHEDQGTASIGAVSPDSHESHEGSTQQH